MKAKTANIILLTVIALVVLAAIGGCIHWLYINMKTRPGDTLMFLAVQSFFAFLIYCVFRSDVGSPFKEDK